MIVAAKEPQNDLVTSPARRHDPWRRRGMSETAEHYNDMLDLDEPWYVEAVELDTENWKLVLHLNFETGGTFQCGACGTPGCKAYDTSRKNWRHLDSLHYQTIYVAPAPRVKCPKCGIRQAELPWARPRSALTYTLEHRISELASEMPLRAVAEIVTIDTASLLRTVRHYVSQDEPS